MTKLDGLINELCPHGVEFRKVKDVFSRIRGTSITAGKMKEIENPDGEIRIFAGGKTVINAFESDIPNANITKVPAVLVQSRGVIDVIYYDKPFTFKNEMWAYTAENPITVKFLYYVLKNNIIRFRKVASGMGSLPQISLPVTEDFKIPVPPKEVQEEIVRILDNFTELTAELTAELDARQKQYSYYRDYLLSFDNEHSLANDIESVNIKTVERIKLEDVCEVYDGTHQTPNYKDSGVKFVSVENIKNLYETKKYISQSDFEKYKIKPQINDVLMTRIGDIGTPAIVKSNEPLAYYVSLALLRPNTKLITAEYLYHYISSKFFRRELNKHTIHTAVPIKINKNDIGKCFINVPSIETQNKIVSILNRFDELCNGISEGLPAEIEARKKQYEYYRDALLSFDEKTCSQIVKVERERELSRSKALKWCKLGDIATITRGGSFQKKDFVEYGKPCIHYGQIYTRYGISATETFSFVNYEIFNKSKIAAKNDIIMAVTSENVNDVCKCVAWLGNENIAISGHTAIIHHNQNPKYLAYYFHTSMFLNQKRKLAHGTKVIEVTPDKLNNVVIPIPPIEEQNRIVSVLDRFDKLCNDISEGLPAEINARQKQYEYYRDKLLTFKEKENGKN